MKRWQLKGGTPFVYAGSHERCVAIEATFASVMLRPEDGNKDGECPHLWHVNDLGFVSSMTVDTDVRVEPYERRT